MAFLTDYAGNFDILRKPAPRIEGGPGGRSGRLSVRIPLDALSDFLAFAAGTVETVDVGGGATMERILPVSFPGDGDLLLMSYRAEAFGGPASGSASFLAGGFSHWQLDCEFATLPYGTDGETAYYTLTDDTGEQFLSIEGLKLHYSNGTISPGDFGLPVPVTNITLTTFLGNTPVSYAVRQMVGKINSVAFEDIPQYMLRFVGIKSDYARGSFSRTLTKSYGFQYRYPHWNMHLRSDGVWDTATLGTSGVGAYLTTDLNLLKYL